MAHRPALGTALDHTVWPWYWAAQHSSDLAVSGQPYSTRQTATSQSGPVSRGRVAFPSWETGLTRAGQGGALDGQDARFHPSQPPAGQAGPSLGPSHLALYLPGFEHRPWTTFPGSQPRASLPRTPGRWDSGRRSLASWIPTAVCQSTDAPNVCLLTSPPPRPPHPPPTLRPPQQGQQQMTEQGDLRVPSAAPAPAQGRGLQQAWIRGLGFGTSTLG